MKRFWTFLNRRRGRRHGREAHRFFVDGRPKNARRGVALLMVTMTLAFASILGYDIGLSGEIRLAKARHEKESLLAEGLAYSGVNMYRLFLVANKQLVTTASSPKVRR